MAIKSLLVSSLVFHLQLETEDQPRNLDREKKRIFSSLLSVYQQVHNNNHRLEEVVVFVFCCRVIFGETR